MTEHQIIQSIERESAALHDIIHVLSFYPRFPRTIPNAIDDLSDAVSFVRRFTDARGAYFPVD